MVDNGSSDAPHVDEGTLHAWLDGALSAEESRVVEAHVAACEACAAAAAEARGLIAASTRILSALDDVPGDVVPATLDARTFASRRARPTRSVRAYASIAAVAAIAIVLTLVSRERTTAVTPQGAPVAARPMEADTTTVAATESSVKPRSSVAVASGTSKRANRADAQKVRASEPAAPGSRSEPAPVVAGVAAAAKSAPSADSLTLTGRVTAAATGLPLADARVSVLGSNAAAVTDSTGAFKVSASPAGSHVLTARKIGFAAGSAVVNVPADRASPVALALSSSPTSLAEAVTAGVLQHADGFGKAPAEMSGAHVVASTVHDAGGSRIRNTTFQLDSGATVTLVEIRAIASASDAAGRSDTAVHVDTNRKAAGIMLRAPSRAETPSVSWIAADGTVMILSGPLSVDELNALKTRVVP
ncbi:MAG TPA: carboxypeptidase regulatory-like domain-containing protein [Gemmatimonadaceae bacterium]|nr:carboxypeptidase regulatory-like domain-containing protein [Gemmatimonadaceae bacterium]